MCTSKNVFYEKCLVQIMDLMCERLNRRLDCLMLVDGNEGFGKSNISVGICGYIAEKMGRKFSVDNVFFDLDELIEFTAKTEQQVILWDEAVLGGLASEWQSKTQKKLQKILMTARKKRHFILFVIPRFFKLNEYIVVDRTIGLIHVYSADNLQIGTFVYINNNNLSKLYFDWKKKRLRNYKMRYSFKGKFKEYLPMFIDEDAYEKKKDKAIESIIETKVATREEYERKAKAEIIQSLLDSGMTIKEISKRVGLHRHTIGNWIKRGVLSGKEGGQGTGDTNNINSQDEKMEEKSEKEAEKNE